MHEKHSSKENAITTYLLTLHKSYVVLSCTQISMIYKDKHYSGDWFDKGNEAVGL